MRTELLHYPYEGRIGTAGNLALPFTPLEINLGEVCSFNIYHLMKVNSSMDISRINILEVGNEK
jgi:hypothetical protein